MDELNNVKKRKTT